MNLSKLNAGFTLVELMIAVVILGILSVVGVQQYQGYIDGTNVRAAQNNLRTIYLQQQEYFTTNNAYYSSGASCGDHTAAINTNLFGGVQALSNGNGFHYCITQTATSNFTAQAVEISAGTPRTYTITQNNVTSF